MKSQADRALAIPSAYYRPSYGMPFNAGNPPENQAQVADQWHFRATTERKAAEARIAAAPPGVKARMLFTQWKPRNGPAEVLAV